MSNEKSNYGFLLIAIKLGTKFGAKIIPTLLKLVKFSKLSWAVSLGAYAAIFNWKFAVMIIASLFVHEYGHVWAMKREGMTVRGMYFIPFLGAVAISDGQFPSRPAETRIALMGPIWGAALAAGTYGIYAITHEPLIATIAGWMALVNLFNLLPVMPLDGGRVLRCITASLSSWLGLGIFICTSLTALFFSAKLGLTLLMFVFVIGFTETLVGFIKAQKNRRRERAAEDLSNLLHTNKNPKDVANAIRDLVNSYISMPITDSDICEWDDGALITKEPFLSTVKKGRAAHAAHCASETMRTTEPDYEQISAALYALLNPLGDLLLNHLRDAAWYRKTCATFNSKNTQSIDILALLQKDLNSYDESTIAMQPKQLAFAGMGYVAITVFLVILLLATKHVPGAEAAFAVMQD